MYGQQVLKHIDLAWNGLKLVLFRFYGGRIVLPHHPLPNYSKEREIFSFQIKIITSIIIGFVETY